METRSTEKFSDTYGARSRVQGSGLCYLTTPAMVPFTSFKETTLIQAIGLLAYSC